MTFGIFQDAYTRELPLNGPAETTGVIGTTTNGVIYLSMPVLSTLLDSGRWASYRRLVAFAGLALSAAAFLLSSWASQIWHLIVLQGVVAAMGGTMLFTPTTLWLNEWFQDGNRATAYGVSLASKNVVGTACPFLMFVLLERLGLRSTLRVWAAVVFATGLLGLLLIPRSTTIAPTNTRQRKVPWTFLRHRTFYIYALANTFQSSGYGLPQTYISSYATRQLHLSPILSSLMIAAFNCPGIISCVCFGLLSDKTSLSPATNTLISAIGSGLCVFLLWGLKSHEIPALLIAFAILFGAFAGGYSSTWGGWLQDLEHEAAANNEAISTGMVYGLFNGARGVGYLVGGLSGVELLELGAVMHSKALALGTKYGAVIVFSGVCSLLGGWATLWTGWGGVKGKWRVGRARVKRFWAGYGSIVV